jgi:hypothetical protein
LGGKESSNGEEAKLEKAAGVLSGQGVKETGSSVGQGLSPSHSLAAKARRGGAGKLGVWDLPGAKSWFRGGLKARDPLGVRAIPRQACQQGEAMRPGACARGVVQACAALTERVRRTGRPAAPLVSDTRAGKTGGGPSWAGFG